MQNARRCPYETASCISHSCSALHCVQPDAIRDNVAITPLIRSIIEIMSDQYMVAASPIQAACCHLAIGDAMRAVQRLVNGEELHLAVALCRVLKLQVRHEAASHTQHYVMLIF